MEDKSQNIERRCGTLQLRSAEGASRHVEGYAAVFDSESEPLGGYDPFIEIIGRGAFDGVVAESDVLALINHDVTRGVLARSRKGEGSLTLEVDERGLKYSFEAPNTPLGEELLENLRRGEIDSSSFAFTVKEDKWENRGTDAQPKYFRTILKVGKLIDVSPVYVPAYSDTTCDTRGLDNMKSASAEEMKRKAQAQQLDNILNKL